MMSTSQCQWIDVLVGSEKREYRLPAKILAHYSPFFDMVINGWVKEGREDPIELQEDHAGDFDAVIEFMITGSVQEALAAEKWGNNGIERCVSFVVSAKKYGLGSVDHVAYDLLRTAAKSSDGRSFRGEYIEKIFYSTSDGSSLRTLITELALEMGGDSLGAPYYKQEKEVHGYAAEVLLQIRLGGTATLRVDSPNKRARHSMVRFEAELSPVQSVPNFIWKEDS